MTITLSSSSFAQRSSRFYTKAEIDSVKKELAGHGGNETVTYDQLMKALQLMHDVGLQDGHKEYISMPGMFKKQVINSIANKLEAAWQVP